MATTQNAPLEKLLTIWRTKKIMPYVNGRHVLDFGCGAHFLTLRAIGNKALSRTGFDILYANQKQTFTADGIQVIGHLEDLEEKKTNLVISLACFEHIEFDALPSVLEMLAKITTPDAQIIGTVPTAAAKPVLEFLSFKLGLIDRSQIEDHKFYYTKETLAKNVLRSGWKLEEYRKFQLGWNCFFKLTKV